MTEKFKKADRQYVLSDSSVNEYGFRLLTAGYQLEEFQKNPIGYYMHRREDGIVLKWDDLRIEGDQVVGTPVINLSNSRGEQTSNEVENGFLNAASVGHIVVLEYSTERDLMLPGQTGPTITKWYNKECSLVDIPGNCNALTRLYDAQENELNLADLTQGMLRIKLPESTIAELCAALNVTEERRGTIAANEMLLISEVKNLVAQNDSLITENKALQDEKHALLGQIIDLNTSQTRHEVSQMLDRALEDKKITMAMRTRLASDYATNPDGLKLLLADMPAYRAIAELLKTRQQDEAQAQWEWDDYEKNDPTGKKLKELRANDPTRYKELFDRKFFGVQQ